MIERLDVLVELMGSVDKTLHRHEKILHEHTSILKEHTGILQRHEERLTAIEGGLKELRVDLLEKVVHYGDHIVLHTDSGTTRAGILRE
jgi:hypothetical protein